MRIHVRLEVLLHGASLELRLAVGRIVKSRPTTAAAVSFLLSYALLYVVSFPSLSSSIFSYFSSSFPSITPLFLVSFRLTLTPSLKESLRQLLKWLSFTFSLNKPPYQVFPSMSSRGMLFVLRLLFRRCHDCWSWDQQRFSVKLRLYIAILQLIITFNVNPPTYEYDDVWRIIFR